VKDKGVNIGFSVGAVLVCPDCGDLVLRRGFARHVKEARSGDECVDLVPRSSLVVRRAIKKRRLATEKALRKKRRFNKKRRLNKRGV